VPFLAIWVSLTVIYGFRLWRLQPTILTWAAVILATGGIIGVQVLKGQLDDTGGRDRDEPARRRHDAIMTGCRGES
jgi:hypothetical protein